MGGLNGGWFYAGCLNGGWVYVGSLNVVGLCGRRRLCHFYIIDIDPHLPSELFHPYQMDEACPVVGVSCVLFHF